MKKLILAILAVAVLLGLGLGYAYVQRFNQDSATSATKGFFFTKTLNLDAYKRVSSGVSLYGSYDNYSRSDRHNETVTVYCNKFCKK